MNFPNILTTCLIKNISPMTMTRETKMNPYLPNGKSKVPKILFAMLFCLLSKVCHPRSLKIVSPIPQSKGLQKKLNFILLSPTLVGATIQIALFAKRNLSLSHPQLPMNKFTCNPFKPNLLIDFLPPSPPLALALFPFCCCCKKQKDKKMFCIFLFIFFP